jgi:putative intracellular protease/amidase
MENFMNNLSNKKALIVLTSIDRFPNTDRKTGFHMDEMATPYYGLVDADLNVSFASITGGKAPIDPGSLGDEGNRKPLVQRFLDDADAMAALEAASNVADIKIEDYDLVFLSGGHGTMWDFAQSDALAKLIGKAYDQNLIIGAVCHGPAGLVSAKSANGEPIVKGKKINSFTNNEEQAIGLDTTVPYLLEDALCEKGALFEGTEKFQAYAVRDGNIITGQNPASAEPVVKLLLETLNER